MSNQDNECPVPQGKLMIIGGAEKKMDIDRLGVHHDVLKEFVKICGESPKIEIITTAGEDAFEEQY